VYTDINRELGSISAVCVAVTIVCDPGGCVHSSVNVFVFGCGGKYHVDGDMGYSSGGTCVCVCNHHVCGGYFASYIS
jgi:hypothetical protein